MAPNPKSCTLQVSRLSNFAPELQLNILSRLPPKDLLRCTSVSKAWFAFVHDHHFVKTHLQRSTKTNSARTLLCTQCKSGASEPRFFSLPFNEDETLGAAKEIGNPLNCPDAYSEMLGYSVNGLVCIHNCGEMDIALWNPSIQRLKKIPCTTLVPQPPDSQMEEFRPPCYGFGYDSVNDDYKLVVILEFVKFVNTDRIRIIVSCQVQIYSLKSSSWKSIQNMPCDGNRYSDDIVFVNGALAWLMHDKFDRNRYILLTLDLASEKYQEFPTPVGKDDNCVAILVVLEDYLCFCVNHADTRHDVWIMEEYGVAGSWTQLYSIVQEAVPWKIGYYFKPVVLVNNREMVFLKVDFDTMCLFDLKKKIPKQVKIHGVSCYSGETTYVGSLCLLDGDPAIVG